MNGDLDFSILMTTFANVGVIRQSYKVPGREGNLPPSFVQFLSAFCLKTRIGLQVNLRNSLIE